jgi:hypothetical protein
MYSGKPSEGKFQKTHDRAYIFTDDTVTKRELAPDEFLRRMVDGKTVYPYWPRARLQNEAATLAFIAANTTIPVPQFRTYYQNNLFCLEVKVISDGILLTEVDEASKPAAIEAVERQLNSDVLPQLRSLRRNSIGSVDTSIPVFPPSRVYYFDRRSWPQITSDMDDFVLCHCDLAPHNIFIDPESFKIVGIIDWEFSGYFPPHFELPLWRNINHTAMREMCAEVNSKELAFFGLKKEDLRNCSVTE